MKSKKENLIEIEPKGSLVFDQQDRKTSTSSITLTNIHENPLVFKIKSNNHKTYAVNPN